MGSDAVEGCSLSDTGPLTLTLQKEQLFSNFMRTGAGSADGRLLALLAPLPALQVQPRSVTPFPPGAMPRSGTLAVGLGLGLAAGFLIAMTVPANGSIKTGATPWGSPYEYSDTGKLTFTDAGGTPRTARLGADGRFRTPDRTVVAFFSEGEIVFSPHTAPVASADDRPAMESPLANPDSNPNRDLDRLRDEKLRSLGPLTHRQRVRALQALRENPLMPIGEIRTLIGPSPQDEPASIDEIAFNNTFEYHLVDNLGEDLKAILDALRRLRAGETINLLTGETVDLNTPLGPGQVIVKHYDGEVGLWAELDQDGILGFVINEGPNTPSRNEMFDLAMRIFGPNVKAIRGTWVRGHVPDFDAFQAALRRELSRPWLRFRGRFQSAASRLESIWTAITRSAFQTFTGQMAGERGFTNVRVSGDGTGGVVALFIRNGLSAEEVRRIFGN
jgi:hypothetical protein